MSSSVSSSSLNEFIKEGEILKSIASEAAKPSEIVVSKTFLLTVISIQCVTMDSTATFDARSPNVSVNFISAASYNSTG